MKCEAVGSVGVLSYMLYFVFLQSFIKICLNFLNYWPHHARKVIVKVVVFSAFSLSYQSVKYSFLRNELETEELLYNKVGGAGVPVLGS